MSKKILKEETFTLDIGEHLTLGYLEPMDLSQNELARNIGVPSSRINSIIKGHTKITMDTDLRLCKYFGMSEGFFLKVQIRIDIILAKRLIEQQIKEIISYKESHPKQA